LLQNHQFDQHSARYSQQQLFPTQVAVIKPAFPCIFRELQAIFAKAFLQQQLFAPTRLFHPNTLPPRRTAAMPSALLFAPSCFPCFFLTCIQAPNREKGAVADPAC